MVAALADCADPTRRVWIDAFVLRLGCRRCGPLLALPSAPPVHRPGLRQARFRRPWAFSGASGGSFLHPQAVRQWPGNTVDLAFGKVAPRHVENCSSGGLQRLSASRKPWHTEVACEHGASFALL